MKYFTILELCHSDNADKYRIDNTPTKEIKSNLQYLIENLLDPIRKRYGNPIYINSGYRSKALNSHWSIKGAQNSQHLTGFAADIDTRKGVEENKKLFNLIKNEFNFDQLINENNYKWIHVSIRPNNRNEVLKYINGTYIRI